MTLADIKSGAPRDSLRRLESTDYAFLWVSDFWDGPISGMLKLDAVQFWFEQFEESEDETSLWYRRYAVVQLSHDQIERENEVHADFQRFVGKHWDYDSRPEEKELRPKEEWPSFYDKHGAHCRGRRFEECDVIAWFER